MSDNASKPFSIYDVTIPEYMADEVQLQDIITLLVDDKEKFFEHSQEVLIFIRQKPHLAKYSAKILKDMFINMEIPNEQLLQLIKSIYLEFPSVRYIFANPNSWYLCFFFHDEGLLKKSISLPKIEPKDFPNITTEEQKNEIYRHLYSKSSPLYLIEKDLFDEFTDYVARHDINLSDNVPRLSLHSYTTIYTNFMQQALQCGATKIFKFLIANGIEPDSFNSAIIGNNREIIRYCMNLNMYATYIITAAAQIHSNALIDWIITSNIYSIVEPFYLKMNARLFLYKSQNDPSSIRYMLQINMSYTLNEIRYLLENNIIKFNSEFRSVIIACRYYEILNYLIGTGYKIHPSDILVNIKSMRNFLVSNITDYSIKDQYSFIAAAAKERSIRLIQHFLDHGCDINEPCENPPLVVAARNEDVEITAFLLDHGADPNLKGSHSWTPLMSAVNGRSCKIVKMLIENGADVFAVSEDGSNLLTAWALGPQNIEILKLLLSKNIDINSVDCYGNTALHRVALNGTIETARFMIEHGADINIRNNKSERPFDNIDRQDMKDLFASFQSKLQ